MWHKFCVDMFRRSTIICCPFRNPGISLFHWSLVFRFRVLGTCRAVWCKQIEHLSHLYFMDASWKKLIFSLVQEIHWRYMKNSSQWPCTMVILIFVLVPNSNCEAITWGQQGCLDKHRLIGYTADSKLTCGRKKPHFCINYTENTQTSYTVSLNSDQNKFADLVS